jgi:hypothetical protein
VDFKDFKLLTYNSRQRLFTISSDGFVTLMEEGYEDQRAEPYMDFTFTAQPDHGEIFSVNGGTSITVSGVGFGVQDATQLGAGDLASARSNLWVDGDFTAGYYSAGGAWATWTAPNTKAVKITNGVRFYAANGIVPNGTYSSDGAGFSFERVTHIAILSEVQLRGYTNGAPLSRKAGQKLRLHLETWHPKYSVSLLNEGVREETVLDTDRERSRTKYDRPHTRADYVETNASNDFLTAGRQDYSIGYSATNTGFQLGTSGVVLGYHQEMQHGLTAPGRSRATQVKLTNSQGRIRLLAAGYAVGGTADKRKGVLV